VNKDWDSASFDPAECLSERND